VTASLGYAQRLGFDRRRQQARLALVGLQRTDPAIAERLQTEVIRPNAQAIVRGFLDWLRHHPEPRRHLREVDWGGLARRVDEHLRTLGVGCQDERYFESRLRVGLVHVSHEVPQSLVYCGARHVQQLIVDRIVASTSSPAGAAPLIDFVLRVTTLDVSLISDTYRLAKVRHLVRSLQEQMDTTRRYRLKSIRDGLTGVYNREHVLGQADEAVREAQATGSPLCLVMLDLDHFKRINDDHGHPVGDVVLKEVATLIRGALRGEDVVGRYGGEEFLLLLKGVDVGVGLSVCERLRKGIGGRPVRAHGKVVPVTVSQGLAQARSGEAAGALIGRADEALYRAKSEGRDRVVVAG